MKKITQPVASDKISYTPFNDPVGGTSIQGIRGVAGSENVYIAGTLITTGQGLLYEGPLAGSGEKGVWNALTFTSPGIDDVTLTSCYGPNNGVDGNVQIVGAYQRSSSGKKNLGFLYEGPASGGGTWTTIAPNGGNVNNVFVHSIMGGIAVGNYDVGGEPNGYAFLYDIKTQVSTTYRVPDSYSTTLYGIWHNGGSSYTLVGGCTMAKVGKLSQAFLVDYDSASKTYSNLKTYQYDNEPVASIVTHFEGITIADDGGYNIAAMGLNLKQAVSAAFVQVQREQNGSFGEAKWTNVAFPGAVLTTGNTVFRNNILGIYAAIATGVPMIGSYSAKVLS